MAHGLPRRIKLAFITQALIGSIVITVGILLTGMGEDGADGMVAVRAGGGLALAESEASCVVYGMPRAAWALTWHLSSGTVDDRANR